MEKTHQREWREREREQRLSPLPLPANWSACLNHVAYQCHCAVMLLRQSSPQSRQPCGPVVRPRISSAFSELETLQRLSPPLRAPLSDMYPEESRGSGGVATVDFLEGAYDYAAPTPATTPLYSHSTPGYYSAPLDAHGPPSDSSLQSLGSGPTSPLVFVPSSPRLSPFMHPPSQHYQETTSTPVYRWGNKQFVFITGSVDWRKVLCYL